LGFGNSTSIWGREQGIDDIRITFLRG
jgi:hypothetical protein